jgi:hypothetical protein
LSEGRRLIQEELENIEARKQRHLEGIEAAKKRREEWREQCELAKIDWVERQADRKLKIGQLTPVNTDCESARAEVETLFAERRRRFSQRAQ